MPTEIRRLGRACACASCGATGTRASTATIICATTARAPSAASAPRARLPVVNERASELYPVQIGLVGRYAVSIQWSDGHDTGIYSYQTLRALCPCAALRSRAAQRCGVVMTARRRRPRAADARSGRPD